TDACARSKAERLLPACHGVRQDYATPTPTSDAGTRHGGGQSARTAHVRRGLGPGRRGAEPGNGRAAVLCRCDARGSSPQEQGAWPLFSVASGVGLRAAWASRRAEQSSESSSPTSISHFYRPTASACNAPVIALR